MKELTLAIATAGLLAAAVPAMAQVGFYAGPGGFSVGVGAPGPYSRDCGSWNNWCRGYYDYYGGPNVVVRSGGWHGRHYHHWHHD